MADVKELIKRYFHHGYENKIIVDLLRCQHGIYISLSTLKRRLQDYGLSRRFMAIDENQLRELIQNETSGPGHLRGYRAVWHSLRLCHNVHVARKDVARILKELDPKGTLQRRSRRLCRRRYTSYGPNFCWHADGYDKLKPYGFPIHGAIDGYSRKVLWLELVRSNNKPEVPAKYYLECVENLSGCPMILRTDCGTENGTMAAMQAFFRQHGSDEFSGSKSHRYGTSPSNQQIEAWWSFYRRGRSSWWIDFFKEMTSTNGLDIGSDYHLECLWFCFHAILQKDLDKVKHHWNTHRIRHSKYGTIPGVPDILFYLPHQSGAVDYKVPVTDDQVNAMEIHTQLDSNDDMNEYQEYFHYVMDNEELPYPCNHIEAYDLFEYLIAVGNN